MLKIVENLAKKRAYFYSKILQNSNQKNKAVKKICTIFWLEKVIIVFRFKFVVNIIFKHNGD